MERGTHSTATTARRSIVSVFRSSLGGKFSLMFLALLFPLVAVGVTIGRGLTANATELLEARRIKELVSRSFALVLTQDDVTKEILLDPARISQADRKIRAYDENRRILREISELTSDAALRRIVERLERLDEEILRPLDGLIIEASADRGAEAALEIYYQQYEPVRREYLELGRRLAMRAEEIAVAAEHELVRRNRRSVAQVVVGLVLGIGIVAVVMLLITRQIQRRLAALMASLERVARGDLRPTAVDQSPDEIGRIGAALSRAISEIRAALSDVSEASNEVETRVGSIAAASGLVASVASRQRGEVARASQAMGVATEKVSGIKASTRALRSTVDDSRATIESIGAASEGIRRKSDFLNERIEATEASVSGMASCNEQMAKGLDVLTAASGETSSSADEMAASMLTVSEVATRSEERWKEMVARGQGGLAKVHEAVAGIEELRATTESAEHVVEGLAERAREIGTVLDVIHSVAAETHLLALNASIIAAQAGEGGRAFSIVAEEVRGLAVRVTTHTREIETLIASVQDGSRAAIEAIARGSRGVSSVQAISAEAGEAVEDMMRLSEENAAQIAKITQAVREQSLAAGRVAQLMEKTDEALEEIREAAKSQASGNREVRSSTDAMRSAASEMSDSAVAQADGLRRIVETVESIRRATETVEQALDEQTRSTLSVGEFLEQVESRSAENTRSAELTSAATQELGELVESLRRAVLRFEL